ncbi:MAG: glycosyltransferase family 2 protein [Bacteroidetes bacterium]|nr:glycosyltransferase family 2 protein [Bacteroidota bacterium]
MLIAEVVFWVLFALIIYSYLGYGLIMLLLSFFRTTAGTDEVMEETSLPEVTLFITAYNEISHVHDKIRNSLEINYPKDKLKHIWITDGSDDGTPEVLREYPEVQVYHEPERRGKIAAMNRGMQFVNTPIVVFSDGNTMLSRDSVKEIVRLFGNPKVGCVAGEKRIISREADAAAGSGEGIYWKYESALKRIEAKVHSVVGAAGELFAIRTELFQPVEPDTLLDDFVISLRIAMSGYIIGYSPRAYATEVASANVAEELKRKVRIAAGGIQAVSRLRGLLNPFRLGMLSFQYLSHKVSRWIIVPLALLLILPVNFLLAAGNGIFSPDVYTIFFWMQLAFYALVLFGRIFENRRLYLKVLFVPYYVFVMNLSCYLGFFRYIKGRQPVVWERAERGE